MTTAAAVVVAAAAQIARSALFAEEKSRGLHKVRARAPTCGVPAAARIRRRCEGARPVRSSRGSSARASQNGFAGATRKFQRVMACLAAQRRCVFFSRRRPPAPSPCCTPSLPDDPGTCGVAPCRPPSPPPDPGAAGEAGGTSENPPTPEAEGDEPEAAATATAAALAERAVGMEEAGVGGGWRDPAAKVTAQSTPAAGLSPPRTVRYWRRRRRHLAA